MADLDEELGDAVQLGHELDSASVLVKVAQQVLLQLRQPRVLQYTARPKFSSMIAVATPTLHSSMHCKEECMGRACSAEETIQIPQVLKRKEKHPRSPIPSPERPIPLKKFLC
jgi:hypothetical protein